LSSPLPPSIIHPHPRKHKRKTVRQTENRERNELESQTEAVLILAARGLASVVLADLVVVVASRKAYVAFLSREGRESRIGEEWRTDSG